MEVIPSLNCPDRSCAKKKIAILKELESAWVHIDVADGEFAPVLLWQGPSAIDALVALLQAEMPRVAIEAHLMVERPEEIAPRWLNAGAKRIAVQTEAVRDLPALEALCKAHGAELILSIAYSSDLGVLTGLLSDRIASVLVLAVKPGFSGEPLEGEAMQKIAFLHKHYPSLLVEVDGGVNLETGKAMKEAGADTLVSGSFIWNAPKPKAAYEALRKV